MTAKGFSLVEAVVTLGIAATLIAVSTQMVVSATAQKTDNDRRVQFASLVEQLRTALKNTVVCTKNFNLKAVNFPPSTVATPILTIDNYDNTGKLINNLVTAGQTKDNLVIPSINLQGVAILGGQNSMVSLTLTAGRPDGTGPVLTRNFSFAATLSGGAVLNCGSIPSVSPSPTTSCAPGPSCDPQVIGCYFGTPTAASCPAGTTPADPSLVTYNAGMGTFPCDCDQMGGIPASAVPTAYKDGSGNVVFCTSNCANTAAATFDAPSNSCQCAFAPGLTLSDWSAVICCTGPASAQTGMIIW